MTQRTRRPLTPGRVLAFLAWLVLVVMLVVYAATGVGIVEQAAAIWEHITGVVRAAWYSFVPT